MATATTDKTDEKKDETPAPTQNVSVVMQQDDRPARAAEAMAEGKRLKLDVAPDGGQFIVNGQKVDVNGKPLKDKES